MNAIPTRRDVLSAAALLGAGVTVPAIAQLASSDAALLEACRDFRRAHADQLALEGTDPSDDETDKVVNRGNTNFS